VATSNKADPLADANREKRNVALSSLAAALVLTLLKVVVGLVTNSLGILAEAAHSALDLVAAGVTLWAVRMSARPADREHHYGHGKFENLAALVETLLLLVTCAWIVYEGVGRLALGRDVEVDPSVWAFAVILVSIVVDVSRSRALATVARKHNSQALEADALHFSTDVWSSTVVLFGLFGVLAAEKFDLPWLVKADAAAALGVAAIVVWVSLKLGRKTVDDLLDRVPQDLQETVEQAIADVPGVERVAKLRLRRSGPQVFADVTLAVDQSAPFEGAHDVASRAEAAVRQLLPEADVVVHVEPVALGEEDATTSVRRLAALHGLAAHAIRIYEEERTRSLELHLEVDDSLDLDEAHRQATEFERAVRERFPKLARIVTHIEPAGDAAATVRAEAAGQSEVRRAIGEFLESEKITANVHDVKVQSAGGELAVSFHCHLDAATAITDAHDFTNRLESHLRRRVPELGRVVIHVEPGRPRGPAESE